MIGLQVSLLVFSLVAPIGAIAADPDPSEPPPSEEPSASQPPEPSTPAAPQPTATPDPEPSAEPAPDPTAEPAPPSPEPSPTPTPAATSPLIVTFAAGVSAADQAAAIDAAGATSTDTIAALRMHAIDASATARDALVTDPRIARVEPDRSRATEADPDDAGYASQWSLPRIGWDQVHGSSVSGSATVAILDTGVDGWHADLSESLVAGTSFVGSSATDDPNGHGTAMAGIVAASTNNGTGIAGVAWDGVSIMPVSVLGADGTGRDSDVIEGLVWAADHGADVALMAFSATGYSSALQSAADYAWSRGMVLVAATGNDGSSSASFPAGDRGVVGVSNTNQSDALNASSNYGDATFIAAPGTGILTLAPGGDTTTVSGTSAAAAHVAAAAAVLRAADGSLSNGVVVGRLARTADAAGTAAETGNGRLNLARAFGDISTEAVQPAGAAPVADGGPFVGPYVAAGNTDVTGTVTSSAAGNPPISAATVVCTAGCSDSATTDASGAYSVKVNYSGNSATVTLTASKPGFTSQSITRPISNNIDEVFNFTLTPANIAPSVDLNGGAAGIDTTATFTEDAGPTAIAPIAVVTDDGPNLASATITLTNRPDGNAVESLAADTTGTSVTATYTAGTGVLSLTGTDTLANYQQVIRSVTYNNTSQNPNTTDRSVTFIVSDGSLNSATATGTVSVARVNDPPVVHVSGDFAAVAEGTTRGYSYTITDPDTALGSITVTELCGSGATRTDTPTADHFECTFLDGPGSST
ncbi:MAG TPA: S8 family serine peptidase, partial [Candidatus Limnocylindrales bacterium]|nr:S8 family serine peptidase [Candidatus Limnocylindrales bacterium]